jgi:hypothetical protein
LRLRSLQKLREKRQHSGSLGEALPNPLGDPPAEPRDTYWYNHKIQMRLRQYQIAKPAYSFLGDGCDDDGWQAHSEES